MNEPCLQPKRRNVKNVSKPVISQQYADQSRLNLETKSSIEIVSITTAEIIRKGNSVSSTSKKQSTAKRRVSFTNELIVVSSNRISEGKPITINTDKYDEYQRYRSAIEWDSSFCTVSSQNKRDPIPYTIVYLNN